MSIPPDKFSIANDPHVVALKRMSVAGRLRQAEALRVSRPAVLIARRALDARRAQRNDASSFANGRGDDEH